MKWGEGREVEVDLRGVRRSSELGEGVRGRS